MDRKENDGLMIIYSKNPKFPKQIGNGLHVKFENN